MQYFFTKFGDVYAGWEFSEMKYPEYTIVIPGTKIQAYRELKPEEKTLEKISEYGWILGNEVIESILDINKFIPQETKHYDGDPWYGNFDQKILFVFGAGASAHCVFGKDKTEFYKDKLRPPLCPDLFDKRFKEFYVKYKGAMQSLYFLQDDNPDVEAIFEREWKNISKENNQEVLSRHINIQYYLQEILKEISNRVIKEYFAKNLYAKLADKLQKIHSASKKTTYGNTTANKKFAFVSFNQDNILEHFISEYFKKPIKTIDDYVNINERPFCIFKPHGSYNWGWKFPDTSKFNGNTTNWLFDNNINFYQLYYTLLGNHENMIDWTNTFGIESMINKHSFGKFTIDKSKLKIIDINKPNDYFPALLLPYRDKDEFTMPIRHFFNMLHYIINVETLIIIGWKGNEDAFNRLLIKNGNRIKKVIIADPNADVVEKNLEPILSKNNIKPIRYNDFEHFVVSGIDNELS